MHSNNDSNIAVVRTQKRWDENDSLNEEGQSAVKLTCQITGNDHSLVQHNYHDHSRDSLPLVSLDNDVHHGERSREKHFPFKLYDMLDLVEHDGYSHVVSWQPHGRCFLVHDPKLFHNILPLYFKFNKPASFRRQLSLYGFIRLTVGPDKGGYYHESFLRGMPSLLLNIRRSKVKGTGFRARPNPEAEPDFWNMPPPQSSHSYASSATEECFSQTDENIRVTDSHLIPPDSVDSIESQTTSDEPSQETSAEKESDKVEQVTTWGMTFFYLTVVEPSQPPDTWSDTENEDECSIDTTWIPLLHSYEVSIEKRSDRV